MRLTYRIHKHQQKRLKAHRAKLQKDLGQEISWQLVLSSIIEAGLDALEIITADEAEGEGDNGEAS